MVCLMVPRTMILSATLMTKQRVCGNKGSDYRARSRSLMALSLEKGGLLLPSDHRASYVLDRLHGQKACLDAGQRNPMDSARPGETRTSSLIAQQISYQSSQLSSKTHNVRFLVKVLGVLTLLSRSTCLWYIQCRPRRDFNSIDVISR